MWITILIFIGIVLFDQISKYLCDINIAFAKTVEVIPNILTLSKVYNTGAAWSILSDATWLLAIISFVATILIGYFCLQNDWKNKKLYSIATTLMLAGTFGNFIDRAMASIIPNVRPGVVDMIIFEPLDNLWRLITGSSFPIFNVADVALVFGVIMLAVYILFFEGKEKKDGETSSN